MHEEQREQRESKGRDQPEFRYRGVKARYGDPEIRSSRGTLLIEALPPIRKKEEMAAVLLKYGPGYEKQIRPWRSEMQSDLIVDALRFAQPLANQIALEQLFSGLIRSGYAGRKTRCERGHA